MSLADITRPADADELRAVIAEAAAAGRPVEPRAAGSKQDIGAPDRGAALLDLGAFRGVVDYEPSELVLTVRPATPLAEIEALLHDRGQMLAFEPFDHGPLFGRPAGAATIGGVVAAGVAGSRRVSAGGARDHLLGFSAVSGRGEVFKGGGKVVKNVTGYDVSKVIAGSWGQLALMTELTLKVTPRPRAVATIAMRGLSAAAAVAAMSNALGSPCAVAAAAHLPAEGDAPAVTALRLEGFRESVDLRADSLRALLTDFGEAVRMPDNAAEELWNAVREARALAQAETLWRAHVAPSQAAALVEGLQAAGAAWFYDWAGALVGIGAPAAVAVRSLVDSFGGHAMLVRAPLALRKNNSARHPEPAGLAALSARLKTVFDPAGVLDPQRFA